MASEEARRHLRRNFRLGIVNGIGINLYYVIMSTDLVMTWFMSELTRSNLLISLLAPIEYGGWYFPQLLLSGYVQRRARVLPLYRTMGLVRLVALSLLTGLVFLVDDTTVLLLLFFALFAVNAVASGVAGLPFLDVISKTIPPRRRGMYFGWRRFLGGVLGLLGGALVRFSLGPDFFLSFPDNYAFLFLLGLLITVMMVVSFGLIVEPEGVVDPRPAGLREQLRHAARLVSEDDSYRRYLGLRLAATGAGYAVPFYAVYARRVLAAPENMVGSYLIAFTLTGVLSNLILGRLGDQCGNRLLMRIMAWSALLPPALALLIPALETGGLETSLAFTLVFVAQGIWYTTDVIGSMNYVMEIAPAVQRAIYIGFANGAVGAVLFISPLGGAVVDWLGFTPLFVFALLCALVAVFFSLRLEEPRARQEATVGTANG